MDSRLVNTTEFHEFVLMLGPVKFTREANYEEPYVSVCNSVREFTMQYSETYTMTINRSQLFEMKLKYNNKFHIKDAYIDYDYLTRG